MAVVSLKLYEEYDGPSSGGASNLFRQRSSRRHESIRLHLATDVVLHVERCKWPFTYSILTSFLIVGSKSSCQRYFEYARGAVRERLRRVPQTEEEGAYCALST